MVTITSVSALFLDDPVSRKEKDILHQPSTPALSSSPLSLSTLNQYKPLIGPGTDSKTRTRRRSERDVKPREMAGLDRKGCERGFKPLRAGLGKLNIFYDMLDDMLDLWVIH